MPLTFKPQSGNFDTILVRPFLEKAVIDFDPNFTSLTIETGDGVSKQLGFFAVEAVIPPEETTLHRNTAVWIMQQFGETLVEAVLHKIASDGVVSEEYLYKALTNGRMKPPIASPIQSGRSSDLIELTAWPEGMVPRNYPAMPPSTSTSKETSYQQQLTLPEIAPRSVEPLIVDSKYL